MTLVLRREGLTEWPEGIERLQRLEQLSLDDNRLGTLSEKLAALPALRGLSLAGNPIEELDAAVLGQLRLGRLDLSRTPLAQLPEPVAALPLTILRLEAMPRLDWDHAFGLLARIPTLASLSLGGNDFRRFPERLLESGSLKVLHLNECRIVDVPPGIARLERLQTLSLWKNALQTIPDEIAGMPSLASLVVSKNPGTRRIKARLRKLGVPFAVS